MSRSYFGVRDVFEAPSLIAYDARDAALKRAIARSAPAQISSFFDDPRLGHRPPPQQIGWFGSDIADAVGDAVGGVLGVVSDVTDVLKDIPGIHQVWGAVNDFAKTPIGEAFFRVAAPVLAPVLFAVPFVGPAIAMVGPSALPGLLRGERLDQAYFNELKEAADKCGQYAFETQAAPAIDSAKTILTTQGEEYLKGMTPPELAEVMGSMQVPPIEIREDLAQLAADGVRGLGPSGMDFDPDTGKWIPPTKTTTYAGGDVANWVTQGASGNRGGGGGAAAAAPGRGTTTTTARATAKRKAGLTKNQGIMVVAGLVGALGLGAAVAKKKGLI